MSALAPSPARPPARFRQLLSALVPNTLLARTFGLIAGTIVLAALSWGAVFRFYQIEPRANEAARFIVSVVNLTRTALITAQPELLHELLLDFSESEGIRIYPSEPTDPIVEPPHGRFTDLVLEKIRAQLGEDTRFAIEREGVPGFWVSFKIEGDEYWVSFPRERLSAQPSRQWLGWGSGALLLALLAAYAIVYRMRVPLAALRTAARHIGRGERPAPLAETGPQELRDVAAAFNQMSSDLARLEEDRALVLAGVSHDLRTPLARMRLGIEMTAGDDNARREMISDIEEMDRIVGQFLDFARSTAGELPAEEIVSDIAHALEQLYAARGAALETSIERTAPQAVRPLALRRLMSNLIDNALRYAGGTVTLTVRPARGTTVIEVLDRGPGIPPADVERLKQPFQRLETARSGTGGSGLGLAIVDRIAKWHDGQFDLLPRDGGGLVARVVLPVR